MGDVRERAEVRNFFYTMEGAKVPASVKSNAGLMLDIFQLLEWLQKPEDFKENLHFLTDKIQRGFATAQMQLSEKEEEIRRLQLENSGLLRQKKEMESQALAQMQVEAALRLQLEREKWGDGGDVGVNVTKMGKAVRELHSTFGAMIASLRKTNSSLGQIQTGSDNVPMPHDVEVLQKEVDQMFYQMKEKLGRWERNQREMQVELGQTREVLESFMKQLMEARLKVAKAKKQVDPNFNSNSNAPSFPRVHFGVLGKMEKNQQVVQPAPRPNPNPAPRFILPAPTPARVPHPALKVAAPVPNLLALKDIARLPHPALMAAEPVPQSAMNPTAPGSYLALMEAPAPTGPHMALMEGAPSPPQDADAAIRDRINYQLSMIQQQCQPPPQPYPQSHPQPPPAQFQFQGSPVFEQNSGMTMTCYEAIPPPSSTTPPQQMPPQQTANGPYCFPCSGCPETFTTLVQLRLHYKVVHKSNPSPAFTEIITIENSPPPLSKRLRFYSGVQETETSLS